MVSTSLVITYSDRQRKGILAGYWYYTIEYTLGHFIQGQCELNVARTLGSFLGRCSTRCWGRRS